MSDQTNNSTERLHALDALRASMMMLGIVFHIALYYMLTELPIWSKDPLNTSIVADWIVLFIHTFRMPIFFVIAGFFTHMMFLRQGSTGLLKNRFYRIGVPLILGLFILTPLFIYSILFSGTPQMLAAVASEQPPLIFYFIPTSWLHLWFLFFLLFFYIVFIILNRVSQLFGESFCKSCTNSFRRLLQKPLLRILLLTLITALTILPMNGDLLLPSALIPDLVFLQAFLFYFVFFGFGWMLYKHSDLLNTFTMGAWLQTAFGILIGGVVLLAVILNADANGTTNTPTTVYLKSIITALSAWLMFFGLMGLFLRYLNKPSVLMRYIVDASYWVYLIHIPLVFIFPGLLKSIDLSALIKMPITMLATTVVCFLSYDLFVRNSFIGKVLNGHRYKRGLPTVPPVASSVA